MSNTPHSKSWLETVRQELASIQYGEILIKIQNAKVVQIEALRKLRLDDSSSKSNLPADQISGGLSKLSPTSDRIFAGS